MGSQPTHALLAGRWRLQLLGGFALHNGDHVVGQIGRRPVFLLLARLALTPGRACDRAELARWLWPVVTGEHGMLAPAVADGVRQRRLRHELNALREQLEPPGMPRYGVLISDRRQIRVDPERLDSDVASFESACERGDAAAARALWTGPLLPGMADPWLDAQRSRLQALRHALQDPSCPAEIHPPSGATPVVLGLPRWPWGDDFQGRGAELAQVHQALREHRVVVLTGAAGIGKSRLAARVAETAMATSVCVFLAVDGRDAADGAGVGRGTRRPASDLHDALRGVLGIVRRTDLAPQLPQGPSAVLQQIVARLAGQAVLLVLDDVGANALSGALLDPAAANDPEVAGETVQHIRALQQALPRLRLLLTTRASVRSPGLCCIALGPLPWPSLPDSPPTAHDLERLRANPCIALFESRARRVRRAFSVNHRNLLVLAQLCRTLEGHPLAIELAARWMHARPLADIATQVRTAPIATLAASARKARFYGRHASVQALLEGGWQGLLPAQRSLLQGLATFEGRFDAQRACRLLTLAGHGALAATVERALRRLADGAWLLEDEDGLTHGAPCRSLRLSWLVRGFVVERIPAAERARWRAAHRALVLSMLEAKPTASADGTTRTIDRGCDAADEPDRLAALASAVEARDAAVAVPLGARLSRNAIARGASPRLLEALRSLVDQPPPAAQGLDTVRTPLARLLMLAGAVDEARFRVAQVQAGPSLPPPEQAETALVAAQISWLADRDAGIGAPLADHALALARQAGRGELEASALLLLGAMVLMGQRDVASAERLFKEAGHAFRIGDRGWPSGPDSVLALPGLVACRMARQDWHGALRLARAAERRAEKTGDVVTRLQLHDRIAVSCEALGDDLGALGACRSQVRLAQTQGLAYYVAYGLWNQCPPLARLGRAEPAALLMAHAAQLWQTRFGALDADDERVVDDVRARVEAQLGTARCASLWTRGARLTDRDAAALGSADEDATT